MGKLDVSFDPAKEVDFVNTYKAKGISQPITGTKALRGRIVKAKEFEFMIKAADGTELGKVTNDENGVITYPQFEYIVDPDLEAGRTTTKDADGYLKTVTITYNNVEELKGATYTATEIVGTGIGITYDESAKETINVTVKVNADMWKLRPKQTTLYLRTTTRQGARRASPAPRNSHTACLRTKNLSSSSARRSRIREAAMRSQESRALT